VGVEGDQVERTGFLGCEQRQRVLGLADADVDEAVRAGILVTGPDRTVRHALFPVTDIPAAVEQALTLAVAGRNAGHASAG